MGVHKGRGHAEGGQGVGQQIVAAAVDGLLGDNVVTGLGQGLNGVADGGRAGSRGQSGYAALKRRNALFQHVLGGVGQTTINITCVRQAEPGGGVGGVVEHIGSGLVDGHRAGIGGGIGLLLTDVKL